MLYFKNHLGKFEWEIIKKFIDRKANSNSSFMAGESLMKKFSSNISMSPRTESEIHSKPIYHKEVSYYLRRFSNLTFSVKESL